MNKASVRDFASTRLYEIYEIYICFISSRGVGSAAECFYTNEYTGAEVAFSRYGQASSGQELLFLRSVARGAKHKQRIGCQVSKHSILR